MKQGKTKQKKNEPGTSVANCNFIGVQYDAKAINAIELIANGLIENAKALGSLANILNASQVKIDALLRIGGKN